MLRICVRHVCAQTRPLIQATNHKGITSNLKCCQVWSANPLRSLASQTQKDENLERIYYGPLTAQIKAVKVFSLSSSAAGVVAQPIIIREAAAIGSTSLLIAICSVVGFFTFITPILLHFITKKYVTEIYYDPATSTYKATTINFFLAEKRLEYKVDDVEVPEIPGMFTTLHAKGKPLFIEARHFNDPRHYAKMMGYDKPMDFKLGEQDSESAK